MSVVPLLPQQAVTEKGDRASRELVVIIQRLVAEVQSLEARVAALEALHP